jgi:hypothetical protein
MPEYIVSEEIDKKYLDKKRPSYRQDPESKHGMEYCVQVPQYIYSTHLQGQTAIAISEHARFAENRAYGNTKQSIDRYKQKYSSHISLKNYSGEFDRFGTKYEEKDSENARGGYMNIFWRLIDVCSKIKDYYHATYDNAEFDIIASAIDQKSGAKKEQMEIALRVFKDYSVELNELAAMVGLPEFKPSFLPDSSSELDLSVNAQGFKLEDEILIEEIVKHTAEISDYLEIIKPKHIDDHLEIGWIAARKYFDSTDHKWKWRYVDPDPLYSGIQGSKTTSFKDAEYGFTVEWEKISSLVGKIYPNEPDREYEALKDNCQAYLGLLGNKSEWSYYDNKDNNYATFGDFRVPVLHASWLDYDQERRLIFLTLSGTATRVKKIGHDEKFSKTRIGALKRPNEKGEILETNRKRLYKSSWIIGTDIAYEYGLDNYQGKNPRIPYVFIKTASVPVVERAIPWIDQINLAFYKHQNALVEMRLDGLFLNQDMFVNQKIGGKIMDAMDQYVMFMQSGKGIFSTKAWDGQNVVPKLFDIIPGGMGKALEDIKQTVNTAYQNIEMETGIPMVMMGVAPAPRTSGKSTEAAMQSSLNITKPCIVNVMWCKNNLAELTANSMAPLLKTDKEAVKAYSSIIGKNGIEVMKLAADYAAYGIKLEPRPDNEDWAELFQLIMQSNERGEIAGDGASMLLQYKQNGYSYKQINELYQQEVRKQRERVASQQQSAQQNQMQMIQAQNQSKAQMMDKEAQNQGALDQQKFAADEKKTNIKVQGKLNEKLIDNVHNNQ